MEQPFPYFLDWLPALLLGAQGYSNTGICVL